MSRRNRRTILTITGIATLVCSTLSALPVAFASAAPRMNDNIGAASRDAQATTADSIARKFPDYVGGNLAGARYNVYLSGSPARAEINELTSSAALPVVVHIVPTPLKKLVAVRNAITRDVKSWASRGTDITLWGANPLDDKVDVYVRGLNRSEARSLTTAYGPLYVNVRRAGPNEILTPLDREADGTPYWGGDFVVNQKAINNSFVGCTTGPTVASDTTNQKYMTTAGHCYPNGTAVENGWYDVQDHSIHGGHANFGKIADDSISHYSSNDLDVEYSPLDVAGDDWGNNGNHRVQKEAATPLGGTATCTSGAYEGEVCGATVSSSYRDMCATYSTDLFGTIKDCHLYRADDPGVTIAGQGDSGGPVYQGVTGGVAVNGIITASGSTYNCPAGPAGQRLCSSTVYFTDMHSILTLNNEHLLIGSS